MNLPVGPKLPPDTIGLLEGLTTTRAIRRYRDEPVPAGVLRAILFGASRAPSGSNRQPFRFVVLENSQVAREAKRILGDAAKKVWDRKEAADGYRDGSGTEVTSPKARMADTMRHYVEHFDRSPVVVLACFLRYREPMPVEGASVYPACQNLLLSARALGYGGALTGFHRAVEPELRALLGIPDHVVVAATITLGKPEGGHGPVRRRPLAETVYGEAWGRAPSWAVDPDGTAHTAAGPPSRPRP